MLFFSFGTYHLNIHMAIHILSIFCSSPMPHNSQGIILVVVRFTISSNLTLDKGLNLTVFNAFSSKRYFPNILSNIHPSVLLWFIIILSSCFIFLGNCYEHTLQYTYTLVIVCFPHQKVNSMGTRVLSYSFLYPRTNQQLKHRK